MKPLISVLIATYNSEKYLSKCLESIKRQTCKDYEIILVDDGSEDNTVLFKENVDVYKKIKHSGIAKARNIAMTLAKGDYFLVVDSDDWIEPMCIEKELRVAQNTGADLVFTDYNIVNDDGIGYLKEGGFFECFIPSLKECFEGKKGIPHGSSFIKKELMDGIWYDETLERAVDYDLLLNIMTNKPTAVMVRVPERLYNVRIRGDKSGSKIHGAQEEKSIIQADCVKRIREKYKKFIE